MSTAFPKIGVLDAAYAFNDIDHFFKWIDQNGKEFFKDFNGGHRHHHRRRLVLRHADVHRDRADPQAGGPGAA